MSQRRIPVTDRQDVMALGLLAAKSAYAPDRDFISLMTEMVVLNRLVHISLLLVNNVKHNFYSG